MIFFAAFPNSVCRVTWERNMSPVARWQTQYFSAILGACVPFPVTPISLRARREWQGDVPAPGGPIRISFGPSVSPTAVLADWRAFDADFSSWSIFACNWVIG